MCLNSKKIIFLIIAISVFGILGAREINKKDFLKSLILPGSGEVFAKHSSGYAFIASEVMIWSSKFYLNKEQKLKDKQSFLQAVKFAHISTDVQFDESYVNKLKNYSSSGFEQGGYNEKVLQQAVELYPNDKSQQEIYLNENMIPENMAWKWDDRQNRHDFGVMRKRIVQYSNYLKLTTGFLLINRLLSVINLARIKKTMELNISLNDNLDTVLSIKYSF